MSSNGSLRRPEFFATGEFVSPRIVALALALAAGTMLILAVWWGGTRGWFGDRILQSGAAILIAAIAVQLGFSRDLQRLPREIWLLAAIGVGVSVLAWAGLSSPTLGTGAGAIRLRGDLAAAGLSGTGPAMGAELFLWSLLPALSILFAASLAGSRGRMWLLALCVVLGMGEGMLAISQLSHRGFGWVRFTWPGDVGVYLGTFANRNHLACLLLAMLPLCVAMAAANQSRQRAGPREMFLRALWASAALVLFTGIVATRSRSGLALAVLAIGATLLLVLRRQDRMRALLASAAVGGLWLFFGGFRLAQLILERMTDPARGDARLTYLYNSLAMFPEYGLGGIGLGNFQRLYGEHVGDAGLARNAVNHVHNDWVEFALETGLIGVAALALGVFVFIRLGGGLWRAWRRDRDASVSLVPGAAWLGAAAIALQSLVDFPLRTTALSCVFALLLATAFAASHTSSRPGEGEIAVAHPARRRSRSPA